jgi:hypothetical protein
MIVFAIFDNDPYGSAIRIGALTSILAGFAAMKINANHGTDKFD